MPASGRIALTAVLGIVLAGDVAVLYAEVSPGVRFPLGTGRLPVVMGITTVLVRAAQNPGDAAAPARRFQVRRFLLLRSRVAVFLGSEPKAGSGSRGGL